VAIPIFNLAILLVLSSGFLHSVWNLYTKRSINKQVFLWFCQLAAIIIFLPWTIIEWDNAPITSTGGWIIVASMLLHGLYIYLLAAAYSIGDLSQMYPIMRGTSPLLVPLLGITLLNEKLSAVGWIGVLSILIGIVLLSNINFKRSESSSLRGPLLALAVGICIASYIVVDKVALNYVSAVVLNEATNIGNLLTLSWAVEDNDRGWNYRPCRILIVFVCLISGTCSTACSYEGDRNSIWNGHGNIYSAGKTRYKTIVYINLNYLGSYYLRSMGLISDENN
jgi:drug/metabolite transporter (DMT)-like permease